MNFNSTKHKRISVKPSGCPNPLFEQWLEEWRKEAADRNSDLQFCFKKALQSLRRYPLKLNSGKECLILKNFGSQLAVKLDRKLAEYHKTHPDEAIKNMSSCSNPTYNGKSHEQKILEIPDEIIKPNKRKKIFQPKTVRKGTNVTQSRSPKNDKVYVPPLRSGSYAILITMLKEQDDSSYRGFMTKAEIIDKAENLSDSSFTRPNPGSFYTAWSSMSTLINKGLVKKCGNPAKYTLTTQGEELASKLHQNLNSRNGSTLLPDCTSPFTSPSKNSCVSSSSYTSPVTHSSCNMQMDNASNSADERDDDTCRIHDMPYAIPSTSEQSLPTNKTTENQYSSTDFEQLIFEPGSFKIFLLVDVMETTGNRRNQITQEAIRELTNLKTNFKIRSLKVGDFAWVACDNKNKELLLPYIVERKRMDDLGKSIKDGRFHEQKFRLRHCGLQNVIYLVEKFGNDMHVGLPVNTLHQAIINSQVVDNFFIKTTNSHKQSMFYLSTLTNLLTNTFKDKMLISCPRKDLPKFDNKLDMIPLLTFQEFSKFSMKNKNSKIQDMFMKHLLQLKGCSVEKASAIVNQYSTPRLLKAAFDSSSNPETLLANLTFGAQNRKIGPVLSQTIHQLYTSRALA